MFLSSPSIALIEHARPPGAPFHASRTPNWNGAALSFADKSLCCHVERARGGGYGRGGSGVVRESRFQKEHTETDIVGKIQNDIITTTLTY